MPTAQEYLNEAEAVLADVDSDAVDLDESDIDSLNLSAIAHATTGLLKLWVEDRLRASIRNANMNVNGNVIPIKREK